MKNIQQIGFIGQGWIGKNYADDFEIRGYETVRYSLEEPYVQNKNKIKNCLISIIAVPTPTTPNGFDDSFLRSALENIGNGNIAVIKSTTIPGMVNELQSVFPDIIILHNPEFLVENTAAYDATNPNRNIVGIPHDDEKYKSAAELLLSVLPKAPYQTIITAKESELVKYAGNCLLYTKVLFMNTLYDIVEKSGGNFATIREALINDPRIGESHTEPIHKCGRGAGGHCFIKDFEAYRQYYEKLVANESALNMLSGMIKYNNELLVSSKKDLDLLVGVYGEDIIQPKGNKY